MNKFTRHGYDTSLAGLVARADMLYHRYVFANDWDTAVKHFQVFLELHALLHGYARWTA